LLLVAPILFQMTTANNGLVTGITEYASRLRFPRLLALTVVLFLVDLAIPDVIPLVDEVLLGLGALLLASWQRHRGQRQAEMRNRPPEA
jgi:hypothetical protein